MSISRSSQVSDTGRFRIGAKSYALTACVCLYRHDKAAEGFSEFVVLTPDMRFAHVARSYVAGDSEGFALNRPTAAVELMAEEAREFLLAHGEGDLVEDFPDLFTIVQRAHNVSRPRAGMSSTAH
jgi:hypothetical protein